MPVLKMWWHWHNHLHRDEFKGNVSPPAQQESSYILNTSTGDETAGHAPYKSSSLTGDCAVVGVSAKPRWWENMNMDVRCFFPLIPSLGCTVMRPLAEAKRLQKARLQSVVFLAGCVDTKVLLSIRGKFTWLQSGGPAGLCYDHANLIWGFGLKNNASSLSFSLSFSLCLPARWRKKQAQSVCLERRVKWLHSVSSSDSFISKPRAKQEVPLKRVFNSDLVYSLFCLNKSRHRYVTVTLCMNSVEMNPSYCISKCTLTLFCDILTFPAEIQIKKKAEPSRNSLKLMIN